MSKITNTPSRAQSIAEQIYAASTAVGIAAQDTKDAQEALNGFREAAVNQREVTLGKVAELATEGDWTEREIAGATKLAAKMGNALTDKSLATFIAETRRAAHPAVREHFYALVAARDDAWAAEDSVRKADKTAPQPLRAAFARRYHTLIRQLGEAAEGVILDTAEALVAKARELDPALNADKMLDKVEATMGTLSEIAATFPDAAIRAAVDCLAQVTLASLKASRAAPGEAPGAEPGATPEPVAAEAVEPAEGAVDLWGDLMAEAA